jgi:hypothetical protein
MHTLACPCALVELTVRGTPLAQFYCHCDDCRKMTSGAYAAESVYRGNDVEVARGEAAVWTLARNPRHFCAACGGRLFIEVEATPTDDVIPNPARRRLDVQMRFARAEEGRARNMLARLKTTDPARARHEQDLARALAAQADIEALRPTVPARAPVKDTPLADKLVRHVGRYKTVIDTLRVALANIESDLAVRLAPHLPRAAEAKKTLANLFAAPGHLRLASGKLYVDLAPAATAPERLALDRLLRFSGAFSMIHSSSLL